MRVPTSTVALSLLLCGCTTATLPAVTVKLPDLDAAGRIGREFTCQGSAKPLKVRLADAPAETVSLVLIVEDLDAPDRPFAHWVVFNAPPSTAWLVPGSLPDGATEGVNDSGEMGYFPPCPLTGTHRYAAVVYALDTQLKFDDVPTARELRAALSDHLVAQGATEGTYTFGADVEVDL